MRVTPGASSQSSPTIRVVSVQVTLMGHGLPAAEALRSAISTAKGAERLKPSHTMDLWTYVPCGGHHVVVEDPPTRPHRG